MARYQILFWQEIPSQIKVWDDFDETAVELPNEFTVLIDKSAQRQGLTSTDDYLAEWRWGEEHEQDGTVQEVADAVFTELKKKFLKT
jgi:hypothetical protein